MSVTNETFYEMDCYYANPDCKNESIWKVNEYHIDVWLRAYKSCGEHLPYLQSYIRRKSNHSRTYPINPPKELKQAYLFTDSDI